jgi:hypothetical protein
MATPARFARRPDGDVAAATAEGGSTSGGGGNSSGERQQRRRTATAAADGEHDYGDFGSQLGEIRNRVGRV